MYTAAFLQDFQCHWASKLVKDYFNTEDYYPNHPERQRLTDFRYNAVPPDNKGQLDLNSKVVLTSCLKKEATISWSLTLICVLWLRFLTRTKSFASSLIHTIQCGPYPLFGRHKATKSSHQRWPTRISNYSLNNKLWAANKSSFLS